MSGKYEIVIGLEIHAELKTERKMFCGCLNNPDEKEPNKNVCPVCLAYPGTLPAANKKAVEEIIKIGIALKGEILPTAIFSRKNYFYPDLPKGYQITSQPNPFVLGGFIEIGDRKIEIDHIHLEEDTGTLAHRKDYSLVDFNRAGVPLMELVTKPCIESGFEARKFCEELQLILQYLEVSEANMEKGEMRCEVNISIREEGEKKFGTKVEIKNLNSFRAVEKSVEYEIERQKKVLEEGKRVIQETRGWDENKGETFSQREKEEAHDYRYFPEPDLPVFLTGDFELGRIKLGLPELPAGKRERLRREYNLIEEQTEILVNDKKLANFFEAAASELQVENTSVGYKTLYNYLVSDLIGLMNTKGVSFSELKITPENFVDLVSMIESGKIGSRVAKNVLLRMFETGADPKVVIVEEGLEQVSDEGRLRDVVLRVTGGNPNVVEDYKVGKEAGLKFLIGQAMKETRGKGNPEVLKKMFEKEIKKS
ncbi:MAG: glutaminyl-tRNA synthase (glutamine-hydrolyzing) subunit B [Candidatus Liptonbacteria bacterium RIFOXYB1_FULL_36_10]|uniref:Aspartyl/glutamyl-tRNA(Asn/Gln) amidotransferase subunit B n=2 Tax=Candidatus Liptoniibacteriota TaxID=1817909 RepID=A0A1G2CPC8_9BACT|nr:MAG: glutaminyl-tRNA synthase (glutamine-hydrolyzing) subunit B [Candidatus Liptonbacteria bacterium RIFOXYD1_FULL_36_11]OGZ03199.1 MAG: glutaminyl-tRNA synthase (glutamine-hydrolyzing) subunit B [Candidatus Liptonbacteria bacterium RIFOXYB1_FULL_36_10]